MPEPSASTGLEPGRARPRQSRRVSTAVSIRPYQEEDEGFLRSLTSRLFLSYGSYDRYILDWLPRPNVLTHVAEVSGSHQPVGYFMAQLLEAPEPERGVDLIAIAVEPQHQMQGVGGALLARCIEIAEAHVGDAGTGIVRLSVADTNARAQRLFARHGFRVTRESGVYPAGQRAIVMRKRIEGDEP